MIAFLGSLGQGRGIEDLLGVGGYFDGLRNLQVQEFFNECHFCLIYWDMTRLQSRKGVYRHMSRYGGGEV